MVDGCGAEARQRPVWTGTQALLLGGSERFGGVAFTPPTVDPPPVPSALWESEYAASTGIDFAAAWRLNAVLGRRDDAFAPGISDVLLTGDPRVELSGAAAVVDPLVPPLEALGLRVEVVHTDGRPVTGSISVGSPDGALLQLQPAASAQHVVTSAWPAGASIALDRCVAAGDGRWTFPGSATGIPTGTLLGLDLEVGTYDTGSVHRSAAQVQGDGYFEPVFATDPATPMATGATSCHITVRAPRSDPGSPAGGPPGSNRLVSETATGELSA